MRLLEAAVSAVVMIASPALAWHDEGHVYVARAAVEALPEEMPAFFRDGRDLVAHCALDPDARQSRKLPQLRDADRPEHYLDSEMLQGRPWPKTRYEFIRLCEELDLEPNKVGTLPYAIAEQAQHLTMAFAEHRKWPDNPHIRTKCLVLAGLLAHFTADLHQPLHTTLHYDGRVGEHPVDSPAAGRGFHARVDALPTKLPYTAIFAEPLDAPEAQADLMAFIAAEFARSHALVDRTYELAENIPPLAEMSLTDEAVRAFAIDRTRAGAWFTASIYLSAWRTSEHVETADWLDRTVFDEHFDPAKVPPQPAP